jgi:hypothetical protein
MSQHHFRDHFRSLLSHRRANFHARIIIHDLIHVPLVQGEFAVRWRFQNAQPISHDDPRTKRKKPDEELSSGTVDEGANSEHESVRALGLTSSSSSTDSSGKGWKKVREPEPDWSQSSYGRYLSPDASLSPTHNEDEIDIPDTFLSSARGKTDSNPLLHDHSVSYVQRIDVEVEMFIDKETKELQSSELKLEVQQNILDFEEKERGHEVFGVVYINLAEYTKAGPVTRRYLLMKSKANTVMRVSIELVQKSGETDYIA